MRDNRRDIFGYEGKYQIDIHLNVWSYRNGKWKPLKPVIGNHGYLTVKFWKDGSGKRFLLHRIYAQAFLPNPNNKPFINHKNGNKTDNRLENLEWVTQKENVKHSWENNFCENHVKGERCHTSKLKETDIKDILQLRKNGWTYQRIADKYGVRRQSIIPIIKGKTWRHITQKPIK